MPNLMPQMATRSTSVNLYSSLTTGSIFVFIQLLRHLTPGLSTSSYKRLKDQKHIRYKLRDALSGETEEHLSRPPSSNTAKLPWALPTEKKMS